MQVWTFEINGGQPFTLAVPGNPVLEHDGKRTVWKAAGPNIPKLREAIVALGSHVVVYTESESEEQRMERQALLEGTWADPMLDGFDY